MADIHIDKNKMNLVYLQRYALLSKAREFSSNLEVVVSGLDEFPAASLSGWDVQHLNTTHEDVDTKIILYTADANAQRLKRVAVYSRDTYVLVLLINNYTAQRILMKTGTSKDRLCIPVSVVRESLSLEVVGNTVAFHVTWTDTTSQLISLTKQSA